MDLHWSGRSEMSTTLGSLEEVWYKKVDKMNEEIACDVTLLDTITCKCNCYRTSLAHP